MATNVIIATAGDIIDGFRQHAIPVAEQSSIRIPARINVRTTAIDSDPKPNKETSSISVRRVEINDDNYERAKK